MEAILRVIIALVLVVGVMWVLAKIAKRPMRGRAASSMDVVARTQLSRGASVAVVKVDGTALVLGVTDHGISLLHETDAAVFETAPSPRRTAIDLDTVNLDSIDLDQVRTRRTVAVPATRGPALAGSALSLKTWRQAIDSFRERSARRA